MAKNLLHMGRHAAVGPEAFEIGGVFLWSRRVGLNHRPADYELLPGPSPSRIWPFSYTGSGITRHAERKGGNYPHQGETTCAGVQPWWLPNRVQRMC
jgi:hypothetical protein